MNDQSDIALDDASSLRTIPVGRGQIAILDADDFERFGKFSWFMCSNGYVFRTEYRGGRGVPPINHLLHREIMGMRRGDRLCVDHIDGDRLNNSKSNLRVCTYQQNQRNVGRMSRNSSGFKGVSWYARERKWVAKITCDKKTKRLGYFDDPALAHEVYCLAADMLHGEFANHG